MIRAVAVALLASLFGWVWWEYRRLIRRDDRGAWQWNEDEL